MARKPTVGGDRNAWGTILNEKLDEIDASVAQVAPGTPGSPRQVSTITDTGPAWWTLPQVAIDAHIGLIPNDAAEAANNSAKLQAYITAIPASTYDTGRAILVPTGPWYLADGIDLSGKHGIVFVASDSTTVNDSLGFGATFVSTVAGTDLFTHDNPGSTIHAGPRFYGINFYDAAGGGRCVYLRNVTRAGFDRCVFRGPAMGSGLTPSPALVYGWSDSVNTGGSLASADCSWNWFQNCTWAGRFDKAVYSNPMGFVIEGGEMTADYTITDNTGIYGFGYMCRAYGVKTDVSIALDWCGHGNEFHLFTEASGSNYPYRLGMRAANINPAEATVNDNNETWGNVVRGHLTGRVPSPTGAIQFGSRAVGHNEVDLSISNIGTPLVAEDVAVEGRNSWTIRRRTISQQVTQIYSDDTSDFQHIVRSRGGSTRKGFLSKINGSAATSVAFAVESQHGPAGAYARTAEALADGTFQTPRHFRHGTATTGTAPTLGFYNATPVVKPTVTGSKGGNAALASLVDALEALGLITDSTT